MSARRIQIACLLPARNAAEDLPGYLESVARCCNTVIALDDGSTDETGALLAESPLVRILLKNPRRLDYRCWDDGANRNRLLAVAAELNPKWILSLDADERIDAEDAAALREFVAGDALEGCAYGLRHFRMWGERACDPHQRWIYRLFAYEPGQVFPKRRLNFNPIPTSIPRRARVRTTIRVRHYGAMNEERLRARRIKYREADPEAAYRSSDRSGLDRMPPAQLALWQPRPTELPVLVEPGVRR